MSYGTVFNDRPQTFGNMIVEVSNFSSKLVSKYKWSIVKKGGGTVTKI